MATRPLGIPANCSIKPAKKGSGTAFRGPPQSREQRAHHGGQSHSNYAHQQSYGSMEPARSVSGCSWEHFFLPEVFQ
jgi:hypothetical protein